MTDAVSMTDQVRNFITANFYVTDPKALKEEDSLLDKGIIDSTGVLELIGFLESTYKIKVEDAEMIPDNLDSVARIVSFVTSKKG